MAKLKIGLYVDDSNLYYRQKEAGWKISYKRLLLYVQNFGDLVTAKYFMGIPSWEPAKEISIVLKNYFSRIGYTVISKAVKRIKDPTKPRGFRNKCNFDVEMADEVNSDIDKVDKFFIACGDSDLAYIKQKIIRQHKKIEYLAFKTNCAWEIIVSHHTFFDDIKTQIIKL